MNTEQFLFLLVLICEYINIIANLATRIWLIEIITGDLSPNLL